ncbi:MAG: hypothetical protein A2958_00375 [Candidatus Levybacteria bacterium RIFCSPLOWO2_01_FULL_38_13]|nr:MAG: hypothetical protein A2629_02055 [Candidatus Levybacteria bacterium RIFCSPHIGHO2_01_FULL_41_15]OGH34747.1 MAG: hypothetical protein A2958_00375 [Candidatus Levybacteria bacterium RIFCSPLOWO2_01_FULL_38_13]
MKKEAALSADLDGVVIGGPTPYLKTLGKRVVLGRRIFEPPKNIDFHTGTESASPINVPLNPYEWVLLKVLARRRVTPQARKLLEEVYGSGIDIFGVTGRPNTQRWIKETLRTLEDGEVMPFFQDVLFRPKHVNAETGKLIHVQRLVDGYKQVAVIEDNPVEGLMIARAFPQTSVFIVQSLTGGMLFSRKESQDYPNVRRIASLRRLSVQELVRS